MNSREISEIEGRLSHGLGQSLSGSQMDYLLKSAKQERAEHVADLFAGLFRQLASAGATMRGIAAACTAARMRTEFGIKTVTAKP